jgi:glutaredoxin 3
MPKVTVYSTDYCPFCHAVKSLLKNKGVDFDAIDVDGDFEKREWLAKTTGQTTVPQVFIGDVSYGGFDDVKALDVEGKLDALLGLD